MQVLYHLNELRLLSKLVKQGCMLAEKHEGHVSVRCQKANRNKRS